MSPTLKDGDTVLVNKIVYLFSKPKIGEIVIAKNSATHTYIIKRIAKKEKGNYFLLGDNKKESTDSRSYGWFRYQDIVGKVIYLR